LRQCYRKVRPAEVITGVSEKQEDDPCHRARLRPEF
jgi:hypothetical protein